jgi:hypothetical protein
MKVFMILFNLVAVSMIALSDFNPVAETGYVGCGIYSPPGYSFVSVDETMPLNAVADCQYMRLDGDSYIVQPSNPAVSLSNAYTRNLADAEVLQSKTDCVARYKVTGHKRWCEVSKCKTGRFVYDNLKFTIKSKKI